VSSEITLSSKGICLLEERSTGREGVYGEKDIRKKGTTDQNRLWALTDASSSAASVVPRSSGGLKRGKTPSDPAC